jgi:hypothetical protein
MSQVPAYVDVTFHADLADALQGEDYWVRAAKANHPLVPHTAESRARARAADPALRDVQDDRLTHYTPAPVRMSAAKAVRVHVKHTTRALPRFDGAAVPSHAGFFVPPAATEDSRKIPREYHVLFNHELTAKTLCFHHPDLLSTEPEVAQIIWNYMNHNLAIKPQFEALAQYIADNPIHGKSKTPWAVLEPVTLAPSISTGNGGKITTTPRKPNCNFAPSPNYRTQAAPSMTNMMLVVKNDTALQGIKWQQITSVSVVPAAPANPPAARAADLAAPLARVEATTADDWNVLVTNTTRVNGLQVSAEVIDAASQQFKITFSDADIRYLGYYIRFYDADRNPIDLQAIEWVPDDQATSTKIIRGVLDKGATKLGMSAGGLIETPTCQFIGYTSGATTLAAIPTVYANLAVTVTMPPGAVAAEVMGSGLGLGHNPIWQTPVFGATMTVLFDLIAPALMIPYEAYNQAKMKDEIDKQLSDAKNSLIVAIGKAAKDVVGGIKNTVADSTIDWASFVDAVKVLFDPAALAFLLWMESQILEGLAEEEIEEEVPFAGWLVMAVDISLQLAVLAETVVEVLTSPFNIRFGIGTTVTTNVNVYPDPQSEGGDTWPQSNLPSSIVVNMTYKGGKRPAVSVSQAIDPATAPKPFIATFPNNIMGGDVKIDVYFYNGSWQAGQASTGWMENNEANAGAPVIYLIQNAVPLYATSIYQPDALLCYQNKAYAWQTPCAAPTATVTTATNTSSSGNAISQWAGVALSQAHGMLGSAFRAAGTGLTASGEGNQLYAIDNVTTPGSVSPAQLAWPDQGFGQQTRMVYDPYPPTYEMASNPTRYVSPLTPTGTSLGDYYIEPVAITSNGVTTTIYHLRKVDLGQTPVTFNQAGGQNSFGCFSQFPDSIVIHPTGAVVAVNRATGKLGVTQLQLPNGLPDDQTPVSVNFAGSAMNEGRAGLLFSPVAVSCSYDGTILALEQTGGSAGSPLASWPAVARIQAFDVNGNSVNRFFDANGAPTPFLPLPLNLAAGLCTYLDMCATGDATMTYMYVLYYTGAGSSPSEYNIAVYQYGTTVPVDNPLVTTSGIAAANIVVDTWHTLFTLNYACVTDGVGNVAGPSVSGGVRTMASMSQWLPPTPTAVTGVSPASGPAQGGTNITIAGSNFTPTTRVYIGGAPATNVKFVDINTLTATTPAHAAGAAPVTTTASEGSGTPQTFTYTGTAA